MIKKSLFLFSLVSFVATPGFANDEQDSEYKAHLMPINNSNVHANVEVEVENRKLEIEIKARGLESGKPHPQHIHGFSGMDRDSKCPDLSSDVDGDGIITITEAGSVFGPIILPLVPFNLVDVNSDLDYEAKFTVDLSSMPELEKLTVVLHGMSVNGEYIPSLPVACGELILQKDD
ncbi:MAG: hypothetical protein OEZ58_08055 [Gammaproteobacteria bacterium]|nr:hypothetical protein [Gammaproteobacteria bacterium]MDH5728930.1 hypothetical protein [Gammaproteobacteria bacterium]